MQGEEILRIEMNNEISKNYFEKRSVSKEEAEDYLLAVAEDHAPSVDYEPFEYEVDEQSKKVAVLYKKSEKDRRPPKTWWENCIKRARRFADSPEEFCGALWYRPEDFPHGEKLRESFGKPYKGSKEVLEYSKILKEAVESMKAKNERKIEEKRGSILERIAFWKKKKGVDEEAMKTEFRTKEERGHPDFSTEGKGEGKWEDFRTSRYSEASLLKSKIARLKKMIESIKTGEKEEIRKRLAERIREKLKRRPVTEEIRPAISKEETRKRLAEKIKERLKKRPTISKEETKFSEKLSSLKAKLNMLKRKIAREIHKSETEDRIHTPEKRERLFRKLFPVSSVRKTSSLLEEKRKKLLSKLATLKERVEKFKKKAVFDPRILTDLSPEQAFGPHPEMADEVGERKREYKVDLAHEKTDEVKKPIPETMKMVTEKPVEVEKAFIERASKVIRLVDKMIEKGVVPASKRYEKIEDLLKFNDFELNRIEKYVDELKSETTLVVDDKMIDLEKIVGD